MNFAFTEDQEMIRKSARDFVRGQSSIERVRKLHADQRGYSPEVYKQMADQGWLGTIVPEQYGGINLGLVDFTCIMEELGKGLIPEPIISSGVAGASTIIHACSETHRGDLLPRLTAGDLTVALGCYEPAGRFDFGFAKTTAREEGDGFVLNGTKSFVPDAATADKLILSARTSGKKTDREGISLFVIDRETAGVKLTPVRTMDHRPRSTVKLKDAKVGRDALMGEPGKAYGTLEKAIDRAIVALCGEMVGIMEEALSMSVAYAKERVQFGRPIGSFQAIKHKCANMYVALETARSALYYAAMAVDDDQPDARAAVSCAKALCSDNAVFITKEAIQIHGGIGFTEEHNIHLYYKRALADAVTFGDADYHRERYATEKGF